MRRHCIAAAVALLSLPLAACPDHYANRPLLDLTSDSAPGAIALAGPRPYSRERLLNDREEERLFLSRLLAGSDKVVFEPQLVRRLRDVMAIKGALSAGAASSDRNADDKTDAPPAMPEAAKVKADPFEDLRMRTAYRAELQSALAAVDLDKLDNHGGNLPYRLEFEATVMPGGQPGQPAVIDLAITPPTLPEDYLDQLYLAWLGYLTQRLNSATFQGIIEPDARILALAAASGLFDVQKLCLEAGCESDGKKPSIRIAVPPGTSLDLGDFTALAPTPGVQGRFANAVSAALNGLSQVRRWPASYAGELNRLIDAFQYRAQAGRLATVAGPRPAKFDALLQPRAAQATVHRVRPLDRPQWISTSSISALSLDLAIAVSSAMAGRSLAADAGFSRDVAGAVETLESMPVVVGYAQTDKPVGDAAGRAQEAHFGWVLPPAVVADHAGKSLVHAQTERVYSLAADVSLPAWWPGADLPLRTGYGGTAWAKGAMIDGTPARVIPLRNEKLDAAALGALTSFLAATTMGGTSARAKIRSVEPEIVSACQDKVAFTVRGDNLWRSPQVTFAGRPAISVKVLPDLGGVRAEVDVKELLRVTNDGTRPNVLERVRLVVDGEDDGDDWFIKIAGRRTGEDRCASPTSASDRAIDGSYPVIFGVAPGEVPYCGGAITYAVDLRNFEPKGRFWLADTEGKVIPRAFGGKSDDPRTLAVVPVTFRPEHLKFRISAPTDLPLVYASDTGIATQTVRLLPCPARPGR